ncbi:MAG TPA: hypothetical protein VFE10_01425 [Phenylobacterium sp.]|jgi:hypothetical protein|nr:hypothetical protein [Phenylobacterium sp.]
MDRTDGRRPSQVDRFLVRAAHGVWLMSRGDQDLESFPDSARAVAAACKAARRVATGGRVGLVVAETTPRELHCYMPREGRAQASAPDYLGLISPGI